MNRRTWSLAAVVAVIGLFAVLWSFSDQPTARGQAVVSPVIWTAPRSTPKLTEVEWLTSSGAPSLDATDSKACGLVEMAKKPDQAPWPAELKPWVVRTVQHLQASGNPADLALSLLVGDAGDQLNFSAQVEAVARAATLSSDPRFYRLAIRVCNRLPSEVADAGPCQQLTLAQLLRLDPENALLWLLGAAGAHARADRAGELDALYHASVAHNFETPTKSAARMLAAAIPNEAPRWVRYALLERFVREQGVASGDGMMRMGMWLAYPCTEGAVADGNMNQLCENLARNLLERSTNPDALWAGVAVAEMLSWPDKRLAPFQRDAWLFYKAKTLIPTLSEATCDGAVQHGLDLLQAIVAERPMALLRSDHLRQGMQETSQKRERAKPPEEEEKEEDSPAAAAAPSS